MHKDERKLKQKIISMLQENTGSHFLDSGGAYGRNWERNQKLPSTIKFWDESPKTWLSVWDGSYAEIYGNISIYHHLVNSLEWDDDVEALNKLWDLYDALYPDKKWYELKTEFIKHIQDNTKSPKDFRNSVMKSLNEYYKYHEEDNDFDVNVKAFESFVMKSPKVKSLWDNDFGHDTSGDNTYNFDNSLSQVFQWERFGDFICLEIHGGCDVRGGYTRPAFFKVIEDAFYDMSNYTIYCDKTREHYWDFCGSRCEYSSYDAPDWKDIKVIGYSQLSDEEQLQFDRDGYLEDSPEVIYATEGQINLPGIEARLKKPATIKNAIVIKDKEAFCFCGGKLHSDKYWGN